MSLLTTFLALRPPAEGDRAAPEAASDLRPTIANALLSDAMLTADDLPAGWRARDRGGAPSPGPFAGASYEELFVGDLRVSFVEPESGARVDQHVGVLPRWAARLPYELDAGGLHDAFSGAVREDAVPLPAPSGGSGISVALRPGATASERDVVILRRGVLVMAIAAYGTYGTRYDGMAGELAIVADERWSALADVLR